MICLKLFGQSAFIIPTMIAILAVSAIVYKKENQKENDKEKDEKEDREKQMERREEMSHAE